MRLFDRVASWIDICMVVVGFIWLVAGIAGGPPVNIVLGALVVVAGLFNMWMRRSPADQSPDTIEKLAMSREDETNTVAGTGQITVRRRRGTAILGGQFEVFIDGQFVASLRPGTDVTLDAPAGVHSVRVRSENYASDSVAVEVAAGGTTTIEVWGSMLRIRYAAQLPERAIAIRRASG